MDIGEAIRTWAVAQPAVIAAVGTRWYPDDVAETIRDPAVCYYAVEGEDEQDLQGLVGLAHVTLRIEVWAETRVLANAAATAIRDTLAGRRGLCGTVFVCGITTLHAWRYDRVNFDDGDDSFRYITSRDYRISFRG